MTDVFISRLNYVGNSMIERVRAQQYSICLERWLWEPGASVKQLYQYEHDAAQFQRERRMFAEKMACGNLYVLADEDCLLETAHPCLDRAADIMTRHPDFAILSWMPINCDIIPWAPATEENRLLVGGTHVIDDEVAEHVSVGGIRLCRKGAMTDWPPMDAGSKAYDGIHCARLRELGWRSGYFRTLRQLHIGRHFSMIANVAEGP